MSWIDNKLVALNEYQEIQLDQYYKWWIDSFQSTARVDRSATAEVVARLYRSLGLDEPAIIWCAGPLQLRTVPVLINAIASCQNPQELRLGFSAQLTRPSWNRLWSNLEPQLDACLLRLKKGRSPDLDFLGEIPELFSIEMLRSNHGAIVSNLSTLGPSICGRIDEGFSNLFQRLDQQMTPRFDVALRARLRSVLLSHLQQERRLRLDPFLQQGHASQTGSRCAAQLMLQIDPKTQTLLEQIFQKKFAAQHLLNPINHGIRTANQLENLLGMMFSLRGREALWGVQQLDWLPLYAYPKCCLDQNFYDSLSSEQLDMWLRLIRAAFGFACFEKVAFVCERPIKMSVDNQGRLHGEKDASMIFPDGSSAFCWHGVSVPPHVILRPELLDVRAIQAETNIEVRRVMIERYGQERFLVDSGAQLVHRDQYGELYFKRLPNDEPMVMVKVVNQTPEPDGTRKVYFLRVPPTVTTAREAVAWTFDQPAGEYNPTEET